MGMKEQVYQFAVNFVDQKISGLQLALQDIVQALTSETKSTAGDKHETGRAMLQLEREKLGKQLAEVEKMKLVLQKVNPNIPSEKVALGALVATQTCYYYISISAGKFIGLEKPTYCISAATPIAQLLLGKKAMDSFTFNNIDNTILAVF
nr:3-oxoacyl-ACP synthase [Flavobacterium sp. ASW18X]